MEMVSRNLQRKHCPSLVNYLINRSQSTGQVADPELDMKVKDDIENNNIKPRKHPGVLKIGTCSLPQNIIDAVNIIAEGHPVKSILSDAKMLSNYLFSRHHPLESEELYEKQRDFQDNVKSKLGDLPESASWEGAKHYTQVVQNTVTSLMNKFNYKWSPLDLHDYSSIVYLFTRAGPNYAAVLRVFSEISKRYPDYQPTNLFDFGSGIGSVSWAAKSCWGRSLKEYMNIDSSSSMNNLADLILKGGDSTADTAKGIYYRGFLPAQHRKYSLVVSAHSLMELSSQDSRLQILLNLWNKTEDFLCVIEQGTKPGFKMVVEARDFILSLSNEESPAHVMAPCPHDASCPKLARGIFPCHFQVSYNDLPVGKRQEIKKELFSYTVIKKGGRKVDKDWPRVVRPVLLRHNHVISRLCTSHGDLREVIFTKSRHGRVLYKCAKVTKWGDLLPVNLPPVTITPDNPSQNDDDYHEPTKTE